ncbi:MAG: hypothetical protein ACXVLX_22800 [Ilumatobacteraceae bacterium]
MPSLSTLPVFIAASLALLVIPGPAVLFILARSANAGGEEPLWRPGGVR